MKKFNKSKVIIPALAMIALTTAASATGTVAWFSVNQAATVTGMQFKTTAGSNLLVAGKVDTDTAVAFGTTAKAADAQFAETLAFTADAVNLTPASTVDGKTFYTTSKAKADGSAIADGNGTNATYVAATNGANVYYVDYSFELKAVASAAGAIKLTELNLLYNNATYTWGTKAWRIAIFADTIASTADGFGATPALHGIYTPSGATNQTTGKAVKTVSTIDTVSYINAPTNITALEAGTTYYSRITTRIWLEGEDTTCTNEKFLSLTNAWQLNMKFEIGGTGVTNIGSAAAVGA